MTEQVSTSNGCYEWDKEHHIFVRKECWCHKPEQYGDYQPSRPPKPGDKWYAEWMRDST